MRIGIYNEPSEGRIGGCEYSVAVLAAALGGAADVDIVHHRASLSLDELAEFAASDLTVARLRYVEPEPFTVGTGQSPLRRYRESRAWHASLSEPYDLFINFTHHYPPFCHARNGVLVVLFPLHDRPFLAFQAEAAERGSTLRWTGLKQLYYDWEWAQRMETYQSKMTISRFAQEWTKRRWGIDAAIVYPPVDTDFRAARKTNLILSVGRFSTTGHGKNQREMVGAFARLCGAGLRGWEYVCAGGLGDSPDDRAYFASVRREGEDCPARVLANVKRARLIELQERAKIFWHGAGYGVGEDHPELMEHFGIATVEAMAAGCVPVVPNRGGQPEIVEHGVNGFLWDSLDELADYTSHLASDDDLRESMAEAARGRARAFSRESFVAPFLGLLSSRSAGRGSR